MISTVWITRDAIPNIIKGLQEYYDSKNPHATTIKTECYGNYEILKVDGKEIKASWLEKRWNKWLIAFAVPHAHQIRCLIVIPIMCHVHN